MGGDVNQQPSQVKRVIIKDLKILYNLKKTGAIFESKTLSNYLEKRKVKNEK